MPSPAKSAYLALTVLSAVCLAACCEPSHPPPGHVQSPLSADGAVELLGSWPLADLADPAEGLDRFEGSGVAVDGERVVVVLDNHHRALVAPMPKVGAAARRGVFVGDPDRYGLDADKKKARLKGFEGVHVDGDRLLMVVEALRRGGDWQAWLVALERTSGTHEVHRLPAEFSHGNKGLEGLALVEVGDASWLLGLAEAPGGDKDSEERGGVIHVYTWEGLERRPDLTLPEVADFDDYSGLDVKGRRVAVVSQESSALWIGELSQSGGRLHVEGAGRALPFPRRPDGTPALCNVEGVSFVDDSTLVVVTDEAKDDDPETCGELDQSVHLVRLPDGGVTPPRRP